MNFRKYLIISLLAINLLGFSQDVNWTNKINQLDKIVQDYGNENSVPSISLAIINGKNIEFINFGTHQLNGNVPTTENSIYQLASLSKTFTGIIAKSLILENVLTVNEPIVNYIPSEFPKRVFKKLQGITIGDLLYHRSGLPRNTAIVKRKNYGTVQYDYTESDFIRDLKKMRIKKKDKNKFSYSNFGYSLLGFIMERASKKSFDELLKEYVTIPYQMFCTKIELSHSDKEKLVTAYRQDDKKTIVEPFTLGKLTPPTGIYSSAQDLSKLLLAQLVSYNKENEDNHLRLTDITMNAWEGTGITYGYGLFDYGNGQYGHGGTMQSYQVEYWFEPTKRLGYVLLTSSGGDWFNKINVEINKILIETQE